MPLSSRTQIVGGGANLLAPVTVNVIPRVVDVGPPGALSDSIARQRLDGAVNYIVVGAANVREGVGATETFRLSEGFISEGAGQDSFRAGRGALAGRQEAVVIGRGAEVPTTNSGNGSVVIGAGALTAGVAGVAVVIGPMAWVSSGSGGVVVGANAQARGNGGVGGGAQVAIGAGAIAGDGAMNNDGTVAIGTQARAAGRGDVVIGNFASQNTTNAVASHSVVIGHMATANVSQGKNVVIGNNTTVSGATSRSNVVLGSEITVTTEQVIAIGRGLSVSLANSAWIGGPNGVVTTFVIGQGDTVASPPARTMRFTNASGTNNAAGNVQIIAPRGTGTAASATIGFSVGVPVGAGTGLHTVEQAIVASYTAVAGETYAMIYDVDSGTLQRVLVGAAGTGPGGVGRGLYLA